MGSVAAGIVEVACRAGEGYGIARAELLEAACLAPSSLADPARQLPCDALHDLTSYLLERTQDRSLGLRFAEAMDLRTQGFWGYLFISCLTLRGAVEFLLRFQRVRHGSQIRFREEDGWGIFERTPDDVPAELQTVFGDAFLATFCLHRQRWVPEARGEMRAFLTYPEEPHHRELRALVRGPITFNAKILRHDIPAWELDLPIRSADPHLLRLAEAQLEEQLVRVQRDVSSTDLVGRVRALVVDQLRDGPSIERVARDLRLSARTLRRRLDALGMSFQRLVEDVRRKRATEYLTRGHDDIERVAERLGYSDPSNFRRAFRRWTGLAPAVYRAQHAVKSVEPAAGPDALGAPAQLAADDRGLAAKALVEPVR